MQNYKIESFQIALLLLILLMVNVFEFLEFSGTWPGGHFEQFRHDPLGIPRKFLTTCRTVSEGNSVPILTITCKFFKTAAARIKHKTSEERQNLQVNYIVSSSVLVQRDYTWLHVKSGKWKTIENEGGSDSRVRGLKRELVLKFLAFSNRSLFPWIRYSQ